jgi:hypothetical protein
MCSRHTKYEIPLTDFSVIIHEKHYTNTPLVAMSCKEYDLNNFFNIQLKPRGRIGYLVRDSQNMWDLFVIILQQILIAGYIIILPT